MRWLIPYLLHEFEKCNVSVLLFVTSNSPYVVPGLRMEWHVTPPLHCAFMASTGSSLPWLFLHLFFRIKLHFIVVQP